MTWLRQIPPRQLRLFLASAIGLSAIALVSVGYRAIGEWQEAAGLVASRRASSAVELLVSALSRDMRGAHTSVLAAAERDRLADGSTADLLHPITGAFTRYPYVEAFFSWRTAPDEEVVFYSRVDRRPAWLSGTASTAALCLVKPLLTLPLTTVSVAAERDLLNQLPSLPQVKDGACLCWLLFTGAAVAANTNFYGGIEMGWG